MEDDREGITLDIGDGDLRIGLYPIPVLPPESYRFWWTDQNGEVQSMLVPPDGRVVIPKGS